MSDSENLAEGESDQTKGLEDAPSKPQLDNRQQQVIDLALTILSKCVTPRRESGSADGNRFPEWDMDFKDALKRADQIIAHVTDRKGEVHLYQVFEEGTLMSAEAIGGRLSQVKWEALTAKNSAEKLLKKFKEKMRSHVTELEVIVPDRAYEKIDKALGQLECDPLVKSVYSNFNDLKCGFMEKLGEEAMLSSKSEGIAEYLYTQKLFEWCFVSMEQKRRNVSKYRPYEIFRFAAQNEWDSDKLIIELNQLAGDFYPGSEQCGSLYSFKAFKAAHPDLM